MIEQIELRDNGKSKILYYDGVAFMVGDVIYEIFQDYKKGMSFDEISRNLEANRNICIDGDRINQTVLTSLSDLKRKSEESIERRYIKFQVRIMGQEMLYRLTGKLAGLFDRRLFIALMLLSIAVSGGFTWYLLSSLDSFTYKSLMLDYNATMGQNTWIIAGIYVLMPLFLLLHEFGHATASRAFRIDAKEIGFGFYIIFPVLYADVTHVWSLTRNRKIAVNLGGVYFQFLCNLVIVALFFSVPVLHGFLKVLFISNSLIAVFSLNPFLRNDGYWVYSDLFGVPNLLKQSFQLPARIWRRKEPLVLPRDLALIAYSIANYSFIIFGTYYFFGYYLAANIVSVIRIFSVDLRAFNIDRAFFLFRFFLVQALLIYFFYYKGKQGYLLIRHKTQKK